MEIRVNLNGKELRAEVAADLTLYDFLLPEGMLQCQVRL